MTNAHDDLEPLEELPDLPDVPESEGRSAAASTGPRELERAPLMLRKAALVLIIASLFPWLAAGGWSLEVILSKLVALAGGYVMWMHVLHSHDEKVPGVFASLGGMHAKALTGVAYLLMLVGLVLPLALGQPGETLVEVLGIVVGLITWCQVGAYEKGGKFNPMFGLIIPLIGVGALGRLATMINSFDLFAFIGSAGVAVAAVIAGNTMVIAMKEAKLHGQAKKKAQMEARKQARRQKNS